MADALLSDGLLDALGIEQSKRERFLFNVERYVSAARPVKSVDYRHHQVTPHLKRVAVRARALLKALDLVHESQGTTGDATHPWLEFELIKQEKSPKSIDYVDLYRLHVKRLAAAADGAADHALKSMKGKSARGGIRGHPGLDRLVASLVWAAHWQVDASVSTSVWRREI